MKSAFFESRPFAVLGLFGIPLLIFTILMEIQFPVEVPEGYQSFIVAFEFTKTPQQLDILFHGFDSTTLKNIDTGNIIDFGFIISYSLFLILFFLKAAKTFQQKWPYTGIFLTVIVLLSDILENIFLFRVTSLYSPGLHSEQLIATLKILHIITWIKWGGLAAIYALFSVKTMGKIKVISTFEGVIFIVPLIMSFWALTGDPQGISNFALSVIVAFALLIFYCIRFHLPEKWAAETNSPS